MANEWADSRNRHVQRAPCCSGLSERSCERILAIVLLRSSNHLPRTSPVRRWNGMLLSINRCPCNLPRKRESSRLRQQLRIVHGLLLREELPYEVVGVMGPCAAVARAALDPLDPLENVFETRFFDPVFRGFPSGTRDETR